MFNKSNFIEIRIVLRPLRIGRVHHSDGCAFQLKLRRVEFQKVLIDEVALSVTAQNHVRRCNREHIRLQLDTVQLLLADVLFLGVAVGFLHHFVHSGNQKACRSTTRVYQDAIFDTKEKAFSGV